ncbi:xanthine dehydrogenase family protein molybdopterin-binding subunit [Salinarimonas ramus]|uniref:Carbon monoxide dehydrogenase n=1 Tax=Salinarimonas ramus TaxID=690164 RepID=A0A917V6D4_9HYPH|nr:xanthine dehydrogenase family protein molybdopterin-binding subunit [Salinarimonas ramus]GGK44356.1 carbon monoxide dehydrogenase [Salinarimonas ramus]
MDESTPLMTAKFGMGQPVPRTEDPTLLRGEGRYTDDLALDGQLHAAIVRSTMAHGVLRGVDVAGALEVPGVVAVYTAKDLAWTAPMPANIAASMKNADGSAMAIPQRKALAEDRVRHVGDPIALVVAETAAAAREGAEAVMPDIDVLPVVADPEAALAEGAPAIWDEVPGNRAVTWASGDAAACEAAFATAAHVTRLRVVSNRVVVAPLEPRAAIATYDPADERFTLRLGSQGTFPMRNLLAKALGVAPEKVRVLTGQVGGSFGMKSAIYPEYVALLHAAKALGKPVRWTDTRSESFVSDHHGRAVTLDGALALDAEGNFLALKIEGVADLGAYLNPVAPLFSTINIPKNAMGVYRTPAVHARITCAYTNTTPVGPYRGAGRPDGNYLMERLVETAAAEMGIDPLELRRRNHVRPEALPYATPAGTTYDSGDFPAIFEAALAAADVDGFSTRREESEARGLLRGIGIGHYCEVTALVTAEMGGLRFEPDGSVTLLTGTLDYGQGHATAFAQVLSEKLGVPFEAVRLVQGDSDRLVAGGGTGGSKSLMASGAAIVGAVDEVIEAGKPLAAHALEAAPVDIVFENGRFAIAGTDRSIAVLELAARLREEGFAASLPDGLARSLDVTHVHDTSPSAYPNGCHVAEVEIDPETGVTKLVRYVAANDFGVVVNPLLVEGQLHGGVVQGIGQALLERVVYDEDGQLLSGSFMDYGLPRADDAPFFAVENLEFPATTNPLGVKGCGEAGCAGALPSVMNAVVDALRPRGVTHMDMPATPQRVWRALRATPARA